MTLIDEINDLTHAIKNYKSQIYDDFGERGFNVVDIFEDGVNMGYKLARLNLMEFKRQQEEKKNG